MQTMCNTYMGNASVCALLQSCGSGHLGGGSYNQYIGKAENNNSRKNASTLSNTQTLDLPNNIFFFANNYPDEISSAISTGLMSLRERAAVAKGSSSRGM